MKTTIQTTLVGILIALVVHPAAADAPAILEIQKAPAVFGPWQKLPVVDLPVTADGAVLDVAPGTNSFYRLKIGLTGPRGAALAIALSDVSTDVVAMATDLVQNGPVPDWVNAMLGPVAYPIYNPTINGGTNP